MNQAAVDAFATLREQMPRAVIGQPQVIEALLIALLGFVSTVALARFIARGDIVE